MQLPSPATPVPFESLSPSRYNAALICPARAVWGVSLPLGALPTAPAALLGSSFHKVMEAVNRGRIVGSAEAARDQARRIFDEEAGRQLAQAHPLVGAKFASPSSLPFYHQKRASAVVRAVRLRVGGASPTPQSQSTPSPALTNANALVVEKSLESSDGLLRGRLDCFDPSNGLLSDYKSGTAPQDGGLSEGEARQLLLYAHLLWENGYEPEEAAVVRSDGKETRLPVTQALADEEGRAARSVLLQLNADLDQGRRIEEMATPSAENCSGCSFVALCPAFWDAAEPSWSISASSSSIASVHIEGQVLAVAQSVGLAGGGLTTLELEIGRGTITRGRAVLEQVPTAWLTCDGDRAPGAGDTVRVTNAALTLPPDAEPGVQIAVALQPASLRVDHFKATAVWTV